MSSILQFVDETDGIAKTRIMYNSSLSYQQLLDYLKYLIDNKLLTYDESNGIYNITRKGLRFLELSNRMMDLLKKMPLVVTPTIKWK